MKKYPFKITSLEKLISDYFEKYLIQNPATVPDTESLAAYLGITREELNALERAELENFDPDALQSKLDELERSRLSREEEKAEQRWR